MKYLLSKTIAAVGAVALLVAAETSHAQAPNLEFMTACDAARTEPVTVGTEGWLFLPAELRHVSAGKFWGEDAARISKATKPETADPLPAILDFKEQLDRKSVV